MVNPCGERGLGIKHRSLCIPGKCYPKAPQPEIGSVGFWAHLQLDSTVEAQLLLWLQAEWVSMLPFLHNLKQNLRVFPENVNVQVEEHFLVSELRLKSKCPCSFRFSNWLWPCSAPPHQAAHTLFPRKLMSETEWGLYTRVAIIPWKVRKSEKWHQQLQQDLHT